MRVGEPLLSRIVSYWDLDQEAFVVQGHRIKLMVQDIFLLTGLPPLGVVWEIHPMLLHGKHIQEFVEHHCIWGSHAMGKTI